MAVWRKINLLDEARGLDCIEVLVLSGSTAEVEGFAKNIMAERGVRHGRVSVIPAEIETDRHSHGPRTPLIRAPSCIRSATQDS
jgi:hypothetical protein